MTNTGKSSVTQSGSFDTLAVETSVSSPTELWRRLIERLCNWRCDWRDGIETQSGEALPPLRRGHDLPNDVAFQAFAVALISGNTRWDRIAQIRSELDEPFQGFSPARYAALSDHAVIGTLVPWFRERRAGAAGLGKSLLNLRQTAAVLAGLDSYPSARHFLESA